MSDDIKVDHDIPPPTNGKRGRSKYPWKELEVGDSFFVLGDGMTHRLSAVASYTGKNLKMKFITRTVDGGCRVWRVE